MNIIRNIKKPVQRAWKRSDYKGARVHFWGQQNFFYIDCVRGTQLCMFIKTHRTIH